MQLDHILFFTAIASSLLVLWRTSGSMPTWSRTAAALVLLVSAFAWLFLRHFAGVIAALAWVTLLLVPTWAGNRQARRSGLYQRQRRFALSPAVAVLIAANLLAFLAEVFLGGATNPLTLHRLGELDTVLVRFDHQYWRLLTALFLHYGLVHLAFNLFALLILGPGLESYLGALRFSLCYLVSGLGSSLTVVMLTVLRLTPPMQLVGASGCIMGIVGAWAGVLLRQRHLPLARQRLANIGLMMALQFAFDVVTPQVSMAAHLGGLVTGLALGLALAPGNTRGM